MKITALIIFSLILIVIVSCTSSTVGTANNENTNSSYPGNGNNLAGSDDEIDLFQITPSNKVPEELTKWFWDSFINAGGDDGSQVTMRFSNVKDQGRIWMRFVIVSSLFEIYAEQEGTVIFEGDKYTYFLNNLVNTTKTKSSGEVKKSEITLAEFKKGKYPDKEYLFEPKVFRWEIRKEEGETYLFQIEEKDINRKEPERYRGRPLN